MPPPQLGWRLPKTVLDTTVTWTPTECEDKANGPELQVAIAVSLVARGVPDSDLGAAYPDSLVTVSNGDLKSFWTDSNLTYKLYAGRGGLLQSLSSHSTSETGAIVGNFLTGITKIAAAAAAAPAGQEIPPNVCGTITKTLHDIGDLRTKIKTDDAKTALDDAARVQSLKDSMTVTWKKTIDPGTDPDTLQAGGLVKMIRPDQGEVEKAGWYGVGASAVGSIHQDQQVKIWLDLEKGSLCPDCKTAASPDTADKKHLLEKKPLPAGALFRQAAYIPVSAEQGPWDKPRDHGKALGDTQIIAFGQFGAGASLPIKAKTFQDINWEVDFSDLGEVTQTTFASKATGLGVSNLFSGAATAASAVQSTLATAAAAPSSDTVKLQVENAALKAQIDNKTLKAQLEALGTKTPGAPSP